MLDSLKSEIKFLLTFIIFLVVGEVLLRLFLLISERNLELWKKIRFSGHMLIHWQATYNTAGKKHVECYAFVSRTLFDIFSVFSLFCFWSTLLSLVKKFFVQYLSLISSLLCLAVKTNQILSGESPIYDFQTCSDNNFTPMCLKESLNRQRILLFEFLAWFWFFSRSAL